MTPTITVFRLLNRRFRLVAVCEIGYRYLDLDLACYWLRFRVSWNAVEPMRNALRSGIGVDWNTRRIYCSPGMMPWDHWKYKFSYSEWQ